VLFFIPLSPKPDLSLDKPGFGADSCHRLIISVKMAEINAINLLRYLPSLSAI
jgi:hypothetical protein